MKARPVLLILLTSQLGYAQQSLNLSLEQAIQKAMDYSYLIKLDSLEEDKSTHKYREALAGVFPKISAEGKTQRFIEAPQINGFSFNSEYETSYGLTVAQPIYKFGFLSHTLKAANKGKELQATKSLITVKQVKHAAKIAYFTVLLAQRHLEIVNGSLENAKKNIDILNKKFGGGRPPRADLIRLHSDVAQRVPLVSSAEKDLKTAKTRLKTLIGIDLNSEITCTTPLQADLSIENRSHSLQQLDGLVEIQVLKKNIELQQHIADAQRAADLPSLGLFYSYNMLRRSNSGHFEPEQNVPTSVIGLSLTWQLWDGGANREKYRKALVDRAEAETKLAQAQDEIRSNLSIIYDEFSSTIANLQNTKSAISLAKESFELSQKRLGTGQTSITELNNAEFALTQAKSNEATLIFQLNRLNADWMLILDDSKTKGIK